MPGLIWVQIVCKESDQQQMTYVSDNWGGCKYRILGECLLISSLPGKVLRTLVDIARLAERFNMRSQSRAW